MVNNKNLYFVSFAILVSLAFVLSLSLTSAYVNSTIMSINGTNNASGSDWFKAGLNYSINFTVNHTNFNSSTNLTQINFSNSNFTFWQNSSATSTVSVNNAQWLCTRWSATLVNCSGGTNSSTNFTVSLNVTLNSTDYNYEVNHSINVSMLTNGTGAGATPSGVNYTGFFIAVDAVDPTITTPFYQWYRNQTSIKNSTSDQLTLNISVSDSGSGGSACYTDINGTNQTFTVSTGWCNFTVGNLTGLSAGNKTLNLYINDSVNNLIVNSTLVLQIDTTGPVVTHTCTPEPVTQGSTLTCTCSSTDATSGVNSSGQSFTVNPSTADTGSYTTECIEFDYGGTKTTSLASYTVSGASSGGSSGGGSGGSSGTTTTWTTQTVTEAILEEGHTTNLGSNNRVQITIDGEKHHVGVVSVSANEATIEVASDPVRVTLSPGEDAKVDTNDDGYYDIHVLLNSITGGKANITITKIYEQMPADQEGSVETTGEVEVTAEKGGSMTWLWIVIGIVLVIIIGGAAARRR